FILFITFFLPWTPPSYISPDGTLLATRDMHSTVTFWDVSGMRLRPLRALDGTFRDALFCPTSGDLQLYDLTGMYVIYMSAVRRVGGINAAFFFWDRDFGSPSTTMDSHAIIALPSFPLGVSLKQITSY
ncbi:hypothetical protein Vafri_12130, partial [Volvox africanus]